MEIFKESEIKYLAGLLDADGCLSFKFCPSSSGRVFLYLTLNITASKKIDRHGYLYSLGERVGSCCEITYDKPTYSDAVKWHVQGRSDLNKLLPRLTKHMVVKGKRWKWMFDLFVKMKGKDVKWLKDGIQKELSNIPYGPVKPKNHPSWPWVAGYLDGDGCYHLSKRAVHIGCITHKDQLDGVELLYKAFGGSVYPPREDNSVLWRRGAGKSNKDFAIPFLKKVHGHSRLKKWKIEQMLNFHAQSQRLTDVTSTEEVIV